MWVSTLYQMLGLPEGADQHQVKAAFRKLARCLHPDVNHSAAAEQFFKEVTRAYKTLVDPVARAEYDRALVRQQTSERRRLRQFCMTATAAGVLSASFALLVLTWAQRPGLSSSTPLGRAGTAVAVPDATEVPGRGANWSVYRNDRFRFAVGFPADVFSVSNFADDNSAVLTSEDDRAELRIFAARNVTGMTLGSYRSSLLKTRYAGVRLDHTPKGKLWFVLSGSRGDRVVYEHVSFSCDGGSIYGWQMVYPAEERTIFDLIADEVARHTTTTSLRCGALPPIPRRKPLNQRKS
jgi:curved DNA-binding protein CbpA